MLVWECLHHDSQPQPAHLHQTLCSQLPEAFLLSTIAVVFYPLSLGTWLQALWVLVTVEALSPFCPATRCWVKPRANKNSKKMYKQNILG